MNILWFFISAVDTGGVFRDITAMLWQKIRFHAEFNGGKLFENDLIQQNSELIEWDYATAIGNYSFGRSYILVHGPNG